MNKYQCAFAVKHDGKTYKPGDMVEMEPEQAADLVARGTLIDGKKAVAPNAALAQPKAGTVKKSEKAAEKLTADPANAPK